MTAAAPQDVRQLVFVLALDGEDNIRRADARLSDVAPRPAAGRRASRRAMVSVAVDHQIGAGAAATGPIAMPDTAMHMSAASRLRFIGNLHEAGR